MEKRGFTLAEVLITLGIIGVVAAMTLPTLITNVQKQIFYTRFMKARNMIENALQMYENEYGIIVDSGGVEKEAALDFVSYFKGAKLIDESNYEEVCAGYDKKEFAFYYDKNERDGGSDICKSMTPYGFMTMDGMFIMFNQDLGDGNGGFIDTDGPDRGPNTVGRDIFIVFFAKAARDHLCNNMWGYTKACAEKKGKQQGCRENSDHYDDCGQRLIDEGRMKY